MSYNHNKKVWHGINVEDITSKLRSRFSPYTTEQNTTSGYKTIDLNPDLRLFIYGIEITDFMSISGGSNVDSTPSALSITISNPKERYCITKQDLMKRWRTDKQDVTQKIFETKYASGIDILAHDPVFGTGDPVRVFMKGRFSQFYYPLFTGYVVDWSLDDTFQRNPTITLTCKDWMWMIEKSYLNINPAMMNESRSIFRSAMSAGADKTNLSIWSNPIAQYTGLKDIFEGILIGGESDNEKTARDLANKVCNEWTPQIEKAQANTQSLKKRLRLLQDQLFLKDMATPDSIAATDLSRDLLVKEIQGLLEIIPLQEEAVKDLQKLKVDALLKISVEGKRTTGIGALNYVETLLNAHNNVFLAEDIEKGLENITRTFPVSYDCVELPGTGKFGWIVKESITFTGYHPALSYDQVSKFGELLNSIHAIAMTAANSNTIGRTWKDTNESPHMKIKEQNDGINDWCYNSSKNINSVMGPRFFVIMPRNIYEGFKNPIVSAFRNLQMTGNDFKSKLEILREIANAIMYNFYATPFGDLFLEPWYNDFAPEDFDYDIVERDKYMKSVILDESIKQVQGYTFTSTGGQTTKFYSGTETAAQLVSTTNIGIGVNPQEYMPRTANGFTMYDVVKYGGNSISPLIIQKKDEIGIKKNWSGDNIRTHVEFYGNAQNDSAQQIQGQEVGSELRIMDALTASPLSTDSIWIADGFQQYLLKNKAPANASTADLQELAKTELKIITEGFKSYYGIEQLVMDNRYMPQWDLAKIYGYKSMSPISVRYVDNKASADLMVKIIFLETLLDTYKVSVEMIYRPECILNRPYYVESHELIGLLSSVSWSYNVNSGITWNCNFKNVRKPIFQKQYVFDYNILSGYLLDSAYGPMLEKQGDSIKNMQAFERIGSILDINMREQGIESTMPDESQDKPKVEDKNTSNAKKGGEKAKKNNTDKLILDLTKYDPGIGTTKLGFFACIKRVYTILNL